MQPIYIEATASGADPQAVCLSQIVPNDQSVVINGTAASGGVVNFPFPRRLSVVGLDVNAEGITLTITGTDEAGAPQVETYRIATMNVAVLGKLEYQTVTSVVSNIGGIGTVEVGTSGIVGSNWARLDNWALGPTNVQIVASGSVNYTLQQTLDDPNSMIAPIDPDEVRWFPSPDTNVVNATGSKMTKFDVNPIFLRILVNSGTGAVKATIFQTGSPNY